VDRSYNTDTSEGKDIITYCYLCGFCFTFIVMGLASIWATFQDFNSAYVESPILVPCFVPGKDRKGKDDTNKAVSSYDIPVYLAFFTGITTFFFGFFTCIMPDLGQIWSRQAVTGLIFISASIILAVLVGAGVYTASKAEFASILVYLLGKDDTIHQARQNAMRCEFFHHLKDIAEPPDGSESVSSRSTCDYKSYIAWQKDRRALRDVLTGAMVPDSTAVVTVSDVESTTMPMRRDKRSESISHANLLPVSAATGSTEGGGGTGSGTGIQIEVVGGTRVKLVYDRNVETADAGPATLLSQCRSYSMMRSREAKAYFDEIRFGAHFSLTLLTAGLFARDFEIRAKVEASQLDSIDGKDEHGEDSVLVEGSVGDLEASTIRRTWQDKKDWVNSDRESFETPMARQIWEMSSAQGYAATVMDGEATGIVKACIRGQVDNLLVSLNVYCDVYAIPCRPTIDKTGYTRTNYIDQEQWDQLFGLGGTDGRTIIDLRDDLVKLKFYVDKANNDRIYPYYAGSLVDGIKESDWLNLISTMKQRSAVYKELKENVGFTTFWERMTEIAKNSPK